MKFGNGRTLGICTSFWVVKKAVMSLLMAGNPSSQRCCLEKGVHQTLRRRPLLLLLAMLLLLANRSVNPRLRCRSRSRRSRGQMLMLWGSSLPAIACAENFLPPPPPLLSRKCVYVCKKRRRKEEEEEEKFVS